MNVNDLFAKLIPEEQELSTEAKERILQSVLESKSSQRFIRPARMGLIAAVLVVLLCVSAVAVYKINWNQSYRDFFNIKSDDIQGFVEYPEVEVTDVASFQPISCVTGVQTLRIRFAYGPVSEEEAEKLSSHIDTVENCVILSEEMLLVEVVELEKWGPHQLGAQEYDAETGMLLFSFATWYEELPEQLTLNISRIKTENLEQIEELGTLVMHPEESEVKVAQLNLRTDGPDGREGGIISLKVDAGSYTWVQDIPGMEDWNDNLNAAVLDSEFGQYLTDWDNLLLEEFYREAYLNFADGTTRQIGAGISCTIDDGNYCQWGGCLYDLGNLVSVTINGVEYPFSDVDDG